jgi:DNA-binding MarR family transcriptional regulator
MLNVLETTTEPVAQRVAQGLRKIGLALKSRRWRYAGRQYLSALQGEILAFVVRQPQQTTMVSAVAAGLAVTRPTASDAVQTLARKGFIRKTPATRDGRVVDVTLTAKGRRQVARETDWPRFLTTAAGRLSPAEQETMLQLVIKLIRLLQERGEIPVARMCVTCRHFQPHVHDDPAQPHHCAFVNEPFGPRLLRIDCAEHEPAPAPVADRNWTVFMGGKS